MKIRTKIRALAVTAITASVITGSMLTAGVASAAPSHAAGVQAVGVQAASAAPAAPAAPAVVYTCSGNVCAGWNGGTSTNPNITVYAPSFPFTGHFELQTPNHETFNSPPGTYAKGEKYTFSQKNGGAGTYCVTAWENSGSGYIEIGYVCIST